MFIWSVYIVSNICTLMICVVMFYVRCISYQLPFPHSHRLANGAAVLLGVGGAVPFAGPAKVSSVWFPPDQRATATSISSFANYFGVGIAFVIGELFPVCLISLC